MTQARSEDVYFNNFYPEDDSRVIAIRAILDVTKTWSQNGKRKQKECLEMWEKVCRSQAPNPMKYPTIDNPEECKEYRESELRKVLAYLARQNKK
jgi:hypothetical protein